MKKKLFISLVLCLHFQSQASTQNAFPFSLKKNTDIGLLGVGLGLGTAGFFAQKSLKPLSEADILSFQKNDIRPRFDRFATNYWSSPVQKASDIALFASWGGAAILTFPQIKKRQNWLTLGVMGAETFLWTYGLTANTKGLARRNRPFVYNPNAPLSEKLKADARASFFSGHTSFSASVCVFSAEIFAATQPDSTWKPWVRAGSIAVPLAVGFLRVRGGKHFTSDVLTGWAIGSFVGWAVPRLHRDF